MTKQKIVLALLGCFLLCSSMGYANGGGRSLKLVPVQSEQSSVAQPTSTAYDPNQFFHHPSAIEEKAFQKTAQQVLPMTPAQIQRLKHMVNETRKVAEAPVNLPPKPTLSTHLVSLSPGATPPVVRLQQGFVTSVVFVDNTGASWPVESYSIGNPQAFNVQWEDGSNTLMIQAMKMYAFGNLAVQLKGLTTPVMVTLSQGQQAVDYRVDLQIQQPGPQAKMTAGYAADAGLSAHQGVNTALLGVLDHVPPQGARALSVSGGVAEAWLFNDKLYLRTRDTLLSPAWNDFMSSPDGMNAYELNQTSTVLVSKDGVPMQLKMEGM